MSDTTNTPAAERVIAETTDWLERVVIGLGLCPFGKAVHVKQQIRYRVSAVTQPSELLAVLEQELARSVTRTRNGSIRRC